MTDGAQECLIKSDSSSDLTDLTSLPSDNDSACDESLTASLDASVMQGSKKSVRFSVVYTREFDVIEIDSDYNDEVQGSLRSLGWSYSEKESDLDTHIDEMKQERKQKYLRMIDTHILRVEIERQNEAREANEIARRMKKKNRFKSKVLKPLWKGFLEAASRSSVMMPNPVIG